MSEIQRLRDIVFKLRAPDGCPWDREQTHLSLSRCLVEEASEVLEAIDCDDSELMEEELGDLLLQVVMHACLAEEVGRFDLEDVARGINEKLVRRHPHVFGDENRDKSAEQQTRDWEAIKAAERAGKQQTGTLDGVAVGLPALLRAYKLQKRAARVGFDWPSTDQVIDKIAEEAAELREARDELTQVEVEEEYGDLLFVMANLGRHLGVEPEAALRAANAKFIKRFQGVEDKLSELGKTPADSDLEEMDRLWDQVKQEQRAG